MEEKLDVALPPKDTLLKTENEPETARFVVVAEASVVPPATLKVPVAVMLATFWMLPEKKALPATSSLLVGDVVPTPTLPPKYALPVVDAVPVTVKLPRIVEDAAMNPPAVEPLVPVPNPTTPAEMREKAVSMAAVGSFVEVNPRTPD